MADSSFDIVSEINWQELTNAVDQAKRELGNRFDFKGSKCSLELAKEELTLVADDEMKMKQLEDIFHSKLIQRGISLKAVTYSKPEGISGGLQKKKATFVSGIPDDMCKKINAIIRDSKLKLKSQTMDQKIRVTGKKKDELQRIMAILREKELTIPLQFTNYR